MTLATMTEPLAATGARGQLLPPGLLELDWWTIAEVATYLGVPKTTVTTYRYRSMHGRPGTMPKEDNTIGNKPLWRPATITLWRPPGCDSNRGLPVPPELLAKQWWTMTDIAIVLGVGESTVRVYRQRSMHGRPEALPPADHMFGNTPVWAPEAILTWNRPGRGANGGWTQARHDDLITRARQALTDPATVQHHLTRRERQVLQLAARGHTGSEIAEALGISVNTARGHLRAIQGKIQ